MSFGHPGDGGLGDRLLAAVLRGEETATSHLAVEHLDGSGPLPRVGERLVLVDHEGRQHGVVETARVRIDPLHLVADDVAHAEGDGSADPEWVLRECEPVVIEWSRLVEVAPAA